MEHNFQPEVRALPAFVTVTGVAKGLRRQMNDRTCRASDLGPVLQLAERDVMRNEIQKCEDDQNDTKSDEMEDNWKSHESDDSSDDKSNDSESDEERENDYDDIFYNR